MYSHLDFSAKVRAANTIASVYEEKPSLNASEYNEPKQQDTMAIFLEALKEMKALGFEKLEDYLKYKESA